MADRLTPKDHNQPDQKAILAIGRELVAAQDEIDDAAGVLNSAKGAKRNILKRAKKAGISTDALLRVLEDRKRDPDELLAEHNSYMRYAAFWKLPVGSQGGLFPDEAPAVEPDRDQVLWEIADAASMAAKMGHERTINNYPPGSEEYVTWDQAWLTANAKMTAAAPEKPTPKAGRKRKSGNPEDAPVAEEGADAEAVH